MTWAVYSAHPDRPESRHGPVGGQVFSDRGEAERFATQARAEEAIDNRQHPHRKLLVITVDRAS